MGLINVPSYEGLNEAALRGYFDIWSRTLNMYHDFAACYPVEPHELDGEHDYLIEWREYTHEAQPEISYLISMLLQSAELRMKALICKVSPYLLLINGSVPLSGSGRDLDFTGLRTLDAVDLPKAVNTFTSFQLQPEYETLFQRLRQVRNKVMHLGVHSTDVSLSYLVSSSCCQYRSLWPEGRWLSNRVKYDGRSANRYFYDYRWTSPVTDAMDELPLTMSLVSNEDFTACVGAKKSSLKVYCPNCMDACASKLSDGRQATATTTSGNTATCLMCDSAFELVANEESCVECETSIVSIAKVGRSQNVCCSHCGHC